MNIIVYRKDTGGELFRCKDEKEMVEKLWIGEWYRDMEEIPPIGIKFNDVSKEYENVINKTAELLKKFGYVETLKELEKYD